MKGTRAARDKVLPWRVAMTTVLHILSQRPSLTGSGVTLDALVRHAEQAGWDQHVICGVPADDPHPQVGGLAEERIHPLFFESYELGFPVPGMSDVMPYRSTVFSAMSAEQLTAYSTAWKRHILKVISLTRPHLIHAHHAWIMSSLLKGIAPSIPVVTQCHATGLRQMSLCPHLADEVKSGCARGERFLVQSAEIGKELAAALGVEADRVQAVGAGFREDLFHTRGRDTGQSTRLLYCGKYSRSKGLPWLLDAVERLAGLQPGLTLHVAGSGTGGEAEELAERMSSMHPVVLHGQLTQPALAELMRSCSVMVLPSFYEGVPLVLVEAAACGCRLVSTRLPGVVENLSEVLGEALTLVPMPRLTGIDSPEPDDLPAFVDDLTEAIIDSLTRPPLASARLSLEPLSWLAVFRRVERVWRELAGPR